ncbi:MAG: YraN family protein, partial [Jiangellaceae bacterium]
MRAKDGVGSYGEQVAVRHLEQAGFTIVARNWRCEIGEIDVIALDGATVVVCEVKTRS